MKGNPEIHELSREYPTGHPGRAEDRRDHQEHGGDAADPVLETRDQRRQEKSEQPRKCQWDEQIARKIKCGDDKRREADFPHADKRLPRRDFGFWWLHQRKEWNVRISPKDVLLFASNYVHEG